MAGAVVLLAGLVLLAPSWLVARDTAAGTLTADQLGSEHLDVRLGALYALERIARDSAGDRCTIAEVLTAYIRQRAPWLPTQAGQYRADWPLKKQPDLRIRAPDVQAALTVLGRGPFPKLASSSERFMNRLDLREVDLRKADLTDAHLQGAQLDGVHLEGAQLEGAHLEGAVIGMAYLQGAGLDGAHLEGARLGGAHLKGAWATAKTVWPEGFAWRAAGVSRIDETFDETIQADQQATVADSTARPAEPAAAEPPKREDPLPEAVRNGSDRDGQRGGALHHE